VTKELVYSFQCEEGQNIGLNKRLPGMTRSDFFAQRSVRLLISGDAQETNGEVRMFAPDVGLDALRDCKPSQKAAPRNDPKV
jgi:hypothetical protein